MSRIMNMSGFQVYQGLNKVLIIPEYTAVLILSLLARKL